MKRHLQCAEQQVSRSNLTKYCACHAERLAYLVLITYETSFTVRGTTGVKIQPHQILRLSRRKTHMLSPHHIWNVIYSARSNRCHHPTSPNTAPATQSDSYAWSSSHMKRHLQCAEQQVSPSNLTKYCACHAKWLLCLILVTYETSFTMRGVTNVTIQPHQILRLPRKMTLQHVRKNVRKRMKRHFQCGTDPSMIRPWSDHETVSPQPASQPRLLFEPTTSIFYCKIQRFAPNLTFQLSPSTAPATKSDTWTSPNTAPATKSDTWTSPSTAPATKSDTCDTWTSPSTAPATQNDSNASSSSHMKRHLQCAEQQVSPSNLTKYCACHAKWLLCLILVTYETSFTMRGVTNVTIQPHQILRLPRKMTLQHVRKNVRKRMKRHFQCGTDPSMIRPWSDHETVSPQPASQPRLLFEPTTSIFYCKIQRFAPNLTFQLSPSAAPATKSNTLTSPSTAPATKSNTWTSPSTAPATKSDTWTSPNAAPATKNESCAWSSLHMKPHFQCAEQQVSLSNLTKYCACHEKWHCKISEKIFENMWNVISNAGTIRAWSEHDPSMIRPWKRKPQPASQPRLLFELSTSIFYWKIQRFAPNLTFKPSPNTAPATKSDTWPSPSTAPATKSNTRTSPSTAPATKSDTWPSPSTAPATKSDTWTSPNTAPVTKSNTRTSPSTAPATKNDTLPLLYCTQLYWTLLLYSSLLNSTLLYSTLLYSTLLYSTVTELYSTLLYSTLLYSTELYWTLPYYSTLFYSTLL